jgi:hypothetical protein
VAVVTLPLSPRSIENPPRTIGVQRHAVPEV